MMFNNQFVLAIKSKGKVLRESQGCVHLPFNSEYALFMKNNHSCRASCSVDIDGTNVLGDHELIIPAYGCIDLERFIVDGDMNKGKKFKFVPLSHKDVQDPTSSENGIVKVTFWKEFQPYIIPQFTYTNDSYGSCPGILRSKTVSSGITFSSNVAYSCCASYDGATVEGSDSNQQFSTTSGFAKEAISTVLTLRLVGHDHTVTVHDTRTKYCSSCGIKVKYNDNFCSGCGSRL